MLTQIRCNQFRTTSIPFYAGLNVVMGDENGSNSIGKSSLLMVVDFAFGGSNLLEHNEDIVAELGHHHYDFTFAFDDEIFHFRRRTEEPDVVQVCNAEGMPLDAMKIAEYHAFLKTKYHIENNDLSFRGLVGPFSRVWGMDNLTPSRPLHTVQRQAASSGTDLLLKIFDQYDKLKGLVFEIRENTEASSALKRAFKTNLIPKIGVKKFRANDNEIDEISREVTNIKDNLAKFALNISEITNKQILELKIEKDGVLKAKLKIDDKLVRVRRNIFDNRHLQSKSLESLKEFFPEVNVSRIVEIEEFHSSIATLLKKEMKEAESELQEQSEALVKELARLDEKISTRLSSIDNPTAIVDRVYDLSNKLQALQRENEFYKKDNSLTESFALLKAQLKVIKNEAFRFIEEVLNEKLKTLVGEVYGAERKSPTLTLTDSGYRYEVFEDTGTGKAYSNLLIFDLALFSVCNLPLLIHDSLLFKNIENAAVANLIQIYNSYTRQTFIAIDEIKKYGSTTAQLLVDRSVVQLSASNTLYFKSWR